MFEKWHQAKDADIQAMALFKRHYSFYRYKDNRRRIKFVGPGEYMVLITSSADALFVWRRFIDKSGQKGVNCAVFRNESNYLSSDLIREAVLIAEKKMAGRKVLYLCQSQKS
jgi:hypothetical protein